MIEALQMLPFLHDLEQIRKPVFTFIAKTVTLLGQEVLPVLIICIIFWCIDKKAGYKFIFVFFSSGVICQTMKISFRIDRPWILDPTLSPVKGALKAATGYSFPSGHTQAATSLFGSLIFYLRKPVYKIASAIIILSVAFSRMYLGVHTLLDVSVSMLITFLLVVLFFTLLKNISNNADSYIRLSLITATVCIFILFYASYLYYSGYIEYDLIKDGFKTVGSGLGFSIGFFIENKYVNFNVKCKNIRLQIIKLVLGISSALIFKSVLKLIFKENIYSDTLRYMFLVIYLVALYPFIFTKLFNYREAVHEK